MCPCPHQRVPVGDRHAQPGQGHGRKIHQVIAHERSLPWGQTQLHHQALQFRGLVVHTEGNMPDAERAFAAAVAANPAYARGHYGLGRAIYTRALAGAARGHPAAERLEELRQAAAELELAVNKNPTLIDAHVALAWTRSAQGDAWRELGDPRQAGSSYEAALARVDTATTIDAAAALRPEVAELRRNVAAALRSLHAAP